MSSPVVNQNRNSGVIATPATAHSIAENENGSTRGQGRRPTRSYEEKTNSIVSPKSYASDDMNDDVSVDTVDMHLAEEDSDSNADVESGSVGEKNMVQSKKKCINGRCNTKRLVLFAIWIVLVIGLIVGLIVGFSTSNKVGNHSAVLTVDDFDLNSIGDSSNVDPTSNATTATIATNDTNTELSSLDNITSIGDVVATMKPMKPIKPSTAPPTYPKETEWPHLVGITGAQAKAELEHSYGEDTFDIIILHENDPTTRDYRFDRIRLFTDDDGIVVRVPRIG